MDENKEQQNGHCHCENSNTLHWIKFALLLITLFLASYLAVYYVLDQIRHSYYIPSSAVDNIDQIIKEQDKMFEKNFGTFPMQNNIVKTPKNPVEIYLDKKSNSYKMVIDLKPFDNNPNNLSIDIQDDKINISGINEKRTNSKENVYKYAQEFVLPKKADTENVTKEKSGSKYVVTIPLDNNTVESNDD